MSSGVREFRRLGVRSLGVQEIGSSDDREYMRWGVREFTKLRVQEFRSSRVREFRSSGVQEFVSSGVPGLGDCRTRKNKSVECNHNSLSTVSIHY